VVALRTYTDAWLFPVPDGGGVPDALRGSPVQVPLPGEPQGEALAFAADGTLLSGSEARGGVAGQIRGVPGAAGLAAPARPAAVRSPLDPAAEPLSPWLTAAIGTGVLAVILALLVIAMVRHGARRD
jgi:hypothetical protein